jgi:hypothetical protein
MTAKQLKNSVWTNEDGMWKVEKIKGGYLATGDKYQFEIKTAAAMIKALKTINAEHIGWE